MKDRRLEKQHRRKKATKLYNKLDTLSLSFTVFSFCLFYRQNTLEATTNNFCIYLLNRFLKKKDFPTFFLRKCFIFPLLLLLHSYADICVILQMRMVFCGATTSTPTTTTTTASSTDKGVSVKILRSAKRSLLTSDRCFCVYTQLFLSVICSKVFCLYFPLSTPFCRHTRQGALMTYMTVIFQESACILCGSIAAS